MWLYCGRSSNCLRFDCGQYTVRSQLWRYMPRPRPYLRLSAVLFGCTVEQPFKSHKWDRGIKGGHF